MSDSSARLSASQGEDGRAPAIPLDVVILFLLVLFNLPTEHHLEFGQDFADLAKAGAFFARLFDGSLVRNPVSALQVSAAVLLLALYALAGAGVLFSRSRERARGVLLSLLVLLLVVLPAVAEIDLRFAAGPRDHAHDGGVIQTEEALRFFLDGTNPYEADYRSTPMAGLPWGPNNPAIIHHPYLPLSFLIHLPGYAIGRALFGAYDTRILYLLLFAVPFFLIPRWTGRGENRLALAALWGLNPFLVPHLIEGRNDVVVVVMLVVAAHLLLARRLLASAVVLGLACSTKQFAVLLLPFYCVHVGAVAGWGETLRRGAKKTLPVLGPIVIFVVPFFLWNPAAFLDDTWAFNVGLSEVSYPLGGTPGYGFANWINAFGLVPSRFHYFPFGIIQAVVLLPLLGVLLRRQRAHPTIAALLAHFSLFLLLFLYFSRLFHHNYLGLIFLFLAVLPFAERLGVGEEKSGS